MYRHIVTPAARALAARAGGVTATRLQAAFGCVMVFSFGVLMHMRRGFWYLYGVLGGAGGH